MKLALSRAAAAAALVLAAPIFAVSAQTNANDPETAQEAMSDPAPAPASAPEAPEAPATPAQAAPAPEAPAAEQEPAEEERICRSIRVDMSSRRKSRVCLTEAGWRELNQQR